MLGKLLKHEFRATARIMWVLYAAILVLSVGMHFAIRYMQGSQTYLTLRILSTIVAAFWVLARIFCVVMTLVLMVQRFHKNLLTDEGYLMFTLPVSVHELVFSKIIVSVVWFLLTGLVVGLGIGLAVLDSEFLQMCGEVIREMIRYFDADAAKLTLQSAGMLAELLLLVIISAAATMLHFYAAMSLGYGFTGHKALWSVVWFFLISFVLQMIGMTLMMATGDSMFSWLFGSDSLSAVQVWNLSVLGAAAVNLIVAGALYVVTWLNLKKRLNLA